jgi:hypothetical protein
MVPGVAETGGLLVKYAKTDEVLCARRCIRLALERVQPDSISKPYVRSFGGLENHVEG